MSVRLDSIERAIADFRDGKAIVVVDDEDRENEGDIIFAASKATPELMAFLVRYSSGLICAPITGDILDRLAIPLMTPHNREKMRTAYTISIDARDGITTGISAADRARTCRVLADSATEPFELNQPGHIIPLRAKDGGVLERAGHTEAAVDFARLAGLTPAGVIGEVLNDDGTLMRAPELREFADEHGIALRVDRGPAGLSTPPRVAGRAARDDPTADRVRRVHGTRLPRHDRGLGAHRPGLRRSRHRGRPDPHPLRVPDRRRVRLAALRLRPAARALDDRDHDGRRRHRRLPARSRGARHRPAAQAAGVRPAGLRAATRSTPTSSSGSARTSATTPPARRSCATSASRRPGC